MGDSGDVEMWASSHELQWHAEGSTLQSGQIKKVTNPAWHKLTLPYIAL